MSYKDDIEFPIRLGKWSYNFVTHQWTRSKYKTILHFSDSPYFWMTLCSGLNMIICSVAVTFLGKLLLYHIDITFRGLTTFEHIFKKPFPKERKKGWDFFQERLQAHGKFWWICLFLPSFISPPYGKRS